MGVESEIEGITTPDVVQTTIGELKFRDGAPLPATAEAAYDYLDRARGVEVFLNAMPGASVRALVKGPATLGVSRVGQALIFDELMDSASLFLTGNTSTLYACPFIDLRADGPTVVEVPPGMLGAFNDMWFRYIGDVGPAGLDRGAGGAYSRPASRSPQSAVTTRTSRQTRTARTTSTLVRSRPRDTSTTGSRPSQVRAGSPPSGCTVQSNPGSTRCGDPARSSALLRRRP